MFDPDATSTRRLSTADLARVVGDLARLDERVEDTERIDQIRLLEELKAAAGAAQARVTAAFLASQRAAQADAGVAPRNVGKGIAAQVALAKRESPARAARYVGWASIVVAELPATFSAWQDGRITEWRAQLVARETAWLTREDRASVDTALAPRLQQLGDRQVEAEAKRLAYRLDPHGYLGRIANAEADRRVTLRPAPDTMTVLTALLPVTSGVAVDASVRAHVDTLRAGGDTRSRGQIMADTLVERIIGQPTATAVPIEINLVMTDTTLFNTTHTQPQAGTGASTATEAGSDEPALIDGYGPIPAELARRLALAEENHPEDQPGKHASVWLRRLYTNPTTGQLVAMESTRRHFPPGLRKYLILRDRTCRTPWCDAPIRHTDHVTPAQSGGATSAANGQGLCEACNHTKQAPGWTAQPHSASTGAGTAVHIITPTGHHYLSRPPDLPGQTATTPPQHARTEPPRQRQPSAAETHFRRLVRAA